MRFYPRALWIVVCWLVMAGVASACAGRDALRLRRMMESGHLFDSTAYSGAAAGTKGLKEVLEDFAKIKNVSETVEVGGHGQLTWTSKNFLRSPGISAILRSWDTPGD